MDTGPRLFGFLLLFLLRRLLNARRPHVVEYARGDLAGRLHLAEVLAELAAVVEQVHDDRVVDQVVVVLVFGALRVVDAEGSRCRVHLLVGAGESDDLVGEILRAVKYDSN